MRIFKTTHSEKYTKNPIDMSIPAVPLPQKRDFILNLGIANTAIGLGNQSMLIIDFGAYSENLQIAASYFYIYCEKL